MKLDVPATQPSPPLHEYCIYISISHLDMNTATHARSDVARATGDASDNVVGHEGLLLPSDLLHTGLDGCNAGRETIKHSLDVTTLLQIEEENSNLYCYIDE